MVLFVSCNNSSDSSVKTIDSVEKRPGSSSTKKKPKIRSDLAGCYRTVIGRDTVLLTIDESGPSVKGKLRFDNYQKDSSHGSIDGSSKGDTLVLWYDFFAEGMRSVMEIVLLRKGDDLLRATGPIVGKGDTSFFKDHKQLRFEEDLALRKIDCSEVQNRLR